jgi:hypothetical protein
VCIYPHIAAVVLAIIAQAANVSAMDFEALIASRGGLATTRDMLAVMSRKQLAAHTKSRRLIRVWHGIYACHEPDVLGRLAALDLMVGRPIVSCMGTAAAMYGFDTENSSRLHVLDPGVRVRPHRDLMVHQRIGAPLRRVEGRLVTAPAWTAIEVARTLRRPRALATLDAAMHASAVTRGELAAAIREQRGRRGIVKVRELIDYADGRAESPMESEARLVFIDGGLPEPELQYWIRDLCGQDWRVDFAWPEYKVVAEYDSIDWHIARVVFLTDRLKYGRLQDCGWSVVSMTVDDVRHRSWDLVARIERQVTPGRLAG